MLSLSTMSSNTESTSDTTAPSVSSLPLAPSTSSRRSSANKLDYLYEISYLDDENKITSGDLPLINPYHAFAKPTSSITRSIKTLIKHKPSATKEYVQSTRFDQYHLPASPREKFVTLHQTSLNSGQGFTHIHFGAVRLALTYHGRKGLPVSARIALLDTRMKKEKHACIGTIETTLNAGTVVFTLFPNFNMSLQDIE